MLAFGDFAVFLHPDRTCIYTEAEASVPMLKYQTQAIREQVDHHREQRHPKDWGLYAATVIAHHDRADVVEKLNHRWWMENARWTYQDQLSLPVVLRQLGVRTLVFPHGLWANPWFHFGSHARDD
jgi:hypothetical protein